jgi:AcrR family transcriptional regulator
MDVNASAHDDPPARPGYRRSAGSPRGEARRQELLERVTEDLAANGLVDFSLRRAARAAGTTHKVLLYHFEGAEDLLRQAVGTLRERRIGNALAAVAREPGHHTLTGRVRAVWPILMAEESGLRRALDQAMGLAMYDPDRYGSLGRGATEQYLPTLMSFCPRDWARQRKREVAELVLATMRGALFSRVASDDPAGTDAALAALTRALEREEAAPH